jgi:hypothetical protein
LRDLSQEELINWLKPTNFDPNRHTIIKAKFKYSCQLCYRPYYVGEYIAFNVEKKKGRHIDCDSLQVRSRARKSVKRNIGLDPKNRGVRESNYTRKYR